MILFVELEFHKIFHLDGRKFIFVFASSGKNNVDKILLVKNENKFITYRMYFLNLAIHIFLYCNNCTAFIRFEVLTNRFRTYLNWIKFVILYMHLVMKVFFYCFKYLFGVFFSSPGNFIVSYITIYCYYILIVLFLALWV